MSSVPSDTGAVAGLPWIAVPRDGVDHAGDFMPGRARINDTRITAVFGEAVAMADAAGLYFDSDRSGRRLGQGLFEQFKIRTGSLDANLLHKSGPPAAAMTQPRRAARLCGHGGEIDQPASAIQSRSASCVVRKAISSHGMSAGAKKRTSMASSETPGISAPGAARYTATAACG